VKKSCRALGSVALLGFLALRLDWSRVAAALGALDAGLWLAALLLYGATQVVSSCRWRLLAAPLGFGGPPRRYVSYYFVGMFFNLVLPTSVGGDVVRAWYLSNQAEAPAEARRLSAFLSVFVERVSGVLMLVTLACVASLWCPPGVPAWVTGTAVGVGVAGVAGVLALPLAVRLLPRRGALHGLAAGCLGYRRYPALLAGTGALSLLVQVANVVLVWLVGRALGLAVAPAYYAVMVPLVALLTMLPLSVNGMGLREAGYVVLLAPVGVGAPEAVALSFLSFAVVTAASLAGVLFYLFGRFPRFEAGAADMEVRGDGEQAVGGHPDQGRARQSQAAA
jgi:uncharacterized membrane protein YbhN (UPF0104 family)